MSAYIAATSDERIARLEIKIEGLEQLVVSTQQERDDLKFEKRQLSSQLNEAKVENISLKEHNEQLRRQLSRARSSEREGTFSEHREEDDREEPNPQSDTNRYPFLASPQHPFEHTRHERSDSIFDPRRLTSVPHKRKLSTTLNIKAEHKTQLNSSLSSVLDPGPPPHQGNIEADVKPALANPEGDRYSSLGKASDARQAIATQGLQKRLRTINLPACQPVTASVASRRVPAQNTGVNESMQLEGISHPSRPKPAYESASPVNMPAIQRGDGGRGPRHAYRQGRGQGRGRWRRQGRAKGNMPGGHILQSPPAPRSALSATASNFQPQGTRQLP